MGKADEWAKNAASEASIAFDLSPQKEIDKLVIDRSFQLRYTLMIVGISVALTVGLGALIWYFLREASEIVAVRAMDPNDTHALLLQKELLRTDHLTLAALVGFGVLLIVIITAGGLYVTRKLAAPLFKVAFHMNEIAVGRLSPIRPLKKGDHLQEFFATFQRMHEALAKRTRAEIVTLDQVVEALDLAGRSEAAEKARKLKREKETFLS